MDARRGNSKASLVDRELYFLVAKFLESGPCQEAAQVLIKELHDHKLLPSRRNWLGEERQLTYKEVQDSSCSHIQTNHLQQLCTKLLSFLHDGTGQPQSLLGTTVLKSLQSQPSLRSDLELKSSVCISKYHHELAIGFRKQPVANICQLVSACQATTNFSMGTLRQGPQLYKSIKKHGSFLGHLAPVFCVLFDHTGRCIITGADDDLLKVWSSETGQLLATLRGHSAEVTDVSLSYDNTMIASGSLDKSVRVWCAQSSASLAVLTGHQSHVTSVQFSPSPIEESRYLASTGKDGYLFFWQWLSESETFSSSPIKFMEKNRMGDQTLCSAFSPGGKYFVTGGTDHIIRVYLCIPGPPNLHAELEDQHTEKIMTVQFGNTGEGLFATGSDDGTVCIWSFREVGWTSIKLEIPKDEVFDAAIQAGKIEKTQVTMVGWEKTDNFLVSATTPDCHIRVWRSNTGERIQTLKGHIGEVFVLETHPSDSRILLSAGHEGFVIFWDMLAGIQLKSFYLEWDEGAVCVFDCKFSPDGLRCAAVDSYGFLTILGFGSDKSYKKHPMEQFFHTDYRPLMRDRNHYVVDEQTLLPPHLLPPPYLVDIDGHAHPACYQEALLRLVRPVEQGRQERSAEEMEDYDEYMKKHLSQVKRHTFGFGRARTNYNSPTSGGFAAGLSVVRSSNGTLGSSSIVRNAESASPGSASPPLRNSDVVPSHSSSVVDDANSVLPSSADAGVKMETASYQGASAGGVSIPTRTSVSTIEDSSVGSSEAMDVTIPASGAGGSCRNEEEAEYTCTTDPMSTSEGVSLEMQSHRSQSTVRESAVGGVSSGSEVATLDTNPTMSTSEGESLEMQSQQSQSTVRESAVGGVSSCCEVAMDTNPTITADGGNQEMTSLSPVTSSEVNVGVGVVKVEESSCKQLLVEPLVNLENSSGIRALEAEAGSVPVFSQEVKISEASPVVATVENNASPLSGSQPSSSTQPTQPVVEGSQVTMVQNQPVAESLSANPCSDEVGTRNSNVSQSDGIQISQRIQLASNDISNPQDGLQQLRQEEPQQPQPPPGSPPQLHVGAERDEEAQINIMDVDEGSQESQNMLSSLVYSLGLTERETKQAIALWHNRTIIPQLDAAEISAELAKRRQLYQEEEENYEEQCRKAELLAIPSPSPGLDSRSKGRSLRSGRTLPDPLEPQRVDSIDSEPVMVSESSESEVDEWNSDGDSDDSSDVSDWTAEAGIKIINESRRKTKRRKLNNHEDDLSSEEEYEEDEEEGGGEPGPSKRAEQRKKSTEELGLMAPPVKKETKPKKKCLAKSLETYVPPDWILQTKPTLSPYLPQVGDIVVYCYQGHELYLEQVRKEKVYPTKNMKMPWQKYRLLPQEFCQITNVRYLIGPPTLCQITLALLSHTQNSEGPSTSETKQRITFQIKYHDMDGVLDFMILDSVYKESLVHHWTPAQNFRSLIDGTYWYGTILEKKPFSDDLPSSCWQCYLVEWGDNKDTDRLSPWDMEPLPEKETFDVRDGSRGSVASGSGDDAVVDLPSSQLLAAASGSELDTWGREGEKDRILSGLHTISGLTEAYQFREPVSLEKVQDYCTVVAFPTDLSTITKRLENGFYRRKLALLWEVEMLCRNARTYNEEDSLIVEHARILTETLWKFINSPDVSDPLQCYNSTPSGEVLEAEVEVREADVTFVPLPQDIQLSEHASTSDDTSYNHQLPPDTPAQVPWISSAQELLNALERNANSSPFLEPVDTDMYSDYLSYVKCPMDLGTMRQKLLSGEYRAPMEFVSDIELIFTNAKSYNAKGSEIYKMTLDLQRVFDCHRILFLKSFSGAETHLYGTRRALGKLATLSKNLKKRTASVSSSESMTSSTVSHGQPPQRRRYPKRRVVSKACHSRNSGHDYQNLSDADEHLDDEDRGRSISSVDMSISSEEVVLAPFSTSRRQTRSMAKRTGKKNGRVSCSEKNGFGMTLRTRGTKRQLEQDSGSDEEESGSETDENDQEDESESDNLSLDVEQEEEEEYEEEEEEEERVEPTVPVCTLRTRSGRLRSLEIAKSPRKRRRKMSSDSDEDLTYRPSQFLTRSSRSGRVVKANTKYS